METGSSLVEYNSMIGELHVGSGFINFPLQRFPLFRQESTGFPFPSAPMAPVYII